VCLWVEVVLDCQLGFLRLSSWILFYLPENLSANPSSNRVPSPCFSVQTFFWESPSNCLWLFLGVVERHSCCFATVRALPSNAVEFKNSEALPASEGHAVAQLVEALRYKPEGRKFDSRWCYWSFSLTYFFRQHYDPGVDSPSNRNKYQEYFLVAKGGRCVVLITLPPSCINCLEIWEPQPPGTLGPVQACNGITLPFTFYLQLYLYLTCTRKSWPRLLVGTTVIYLYFTSHWAFKCRK
jgi:hypothetical protein